MPNKIRKWCNTIQGRESRQVQEVIIVYVLVESTMLTYRNPFEYHLFIPHMGCCIAYAYAQMNEIEN